MDCRPTPPHSRYSFSHSLSAFLSDHYLRGHNIILWRHPFAVWWWQGCTLRGGLSPFWAADKACVQAEGARKSPRPLPSSCQTRRGGSVQTCITLPCLVLISLNWGLGYCRSMLSERVLCVCLSIISFFFLLLSSGRAKNLPSFA